MEILALLQDNLFALADGTGGNVDDTGTNESWLESEAACELLEGVLPMASDAA